MVLKIKPAALSASSAAVGRVKSDGGHKVRHFSLQQVLHWRWDSSQLYTLVYGGVNKGEGGVRRDYTAHNYDSRKKYAEDDAERSEAGGEQGPLGAAFLLDGEQGGGAGPVKT